MSYYVSFPKIKEKVSFFLTVPLGPLNHIVPNLTLLTVDLIWVKYILSCLLHKNIDLGDIEQVNEMILDPNFGAYNRVLTWSFEYASRNVEPPQGILIATRWNYGKKARENNRDFFNFMGMGRFIKDFLDTKNPTKLLDDAKKYSKGSFSEVSKHFPFFEEKFKRDVIGVNLSRFPIRAYFRRVLGQLKPEHFKGKREEFVSLFIADFLMQFRETSEIEKSGIINGHTLYHYVRFVVQELGISRKEDILEKFKKDEESLRAIFPEPELLRPTLSDEGFDAFLILKLIKENTGEHFHSFVISTYLKRRNIDFGHDYLDIYGGLRTEDFNNHVKSLEKALSKFGSDFSPLKLDHGLLKFLSIWWEYYQFAFIGERITRDIQGYFLDDLAKAEIRKKISDEDLETLIQFLGNCIMSRRDYVEALGKDENAEQILLQLEEMELCKDANSIFEYLFKRVASQSFPEYTSYPFFPSLDSFERWVDELRVILKLT